MIIHNPIISGSIQFPADADGNKVTLQVNSGVLETIQIDSSNNATAVKPESNLSGSFTGSFQGDGSSLTGVSAINIDALGSLGGASVAQGDNLVISDAGTEKKVTFSNLEDSVFGNVSGDITIAAGGASTLASIANSKLANSSITIDGSAISLGGSVTTTNTQLSTEAVQDIAGALVATGGTKTGIAVTYDDDNANMDFVVTFPSQTDENFTTADHSKLNAIEASADVTDTTNVTAAGALMDSELTDLAGVKGVTISTLQAKPSEGAFANGDKTKLDTIASSANNYVLPTNLDGDDIDIDTTPLTGATVISDLDINITTNTSGLVTDANGTVSTRELTATDLSLGNVTNESKATMFTSPTFTGTVAGVTATHVGLGSSDNVTFNKITGSGIEITGVTNYNGLTIKAGGASRPGINFENVTQGQLGGIFGTEGNSLGLSTQGGIEYVIRNANGASGDHLFNSYNTTILKLDGATNASTFGGELIISSSQTGFATTIRNVHDSSEGLLVQSTDNDSGEYLIKLQSSNGTLLEDSADWVDRFTVSKSGVAEIGSTLKSSTYLVNRTSAAGIGTTLGDINGIELGPGYLTLARDDTADAKQLSFYKNNVAHSYLETTSTGLNIGGANVGFTNNVNIGNWTPGNASRVAIRGTGTYNNTMSRSGATLQIISDELSNDAWSPVFNIGIVRQSLTTGKDSFGGIGFTTIDDSNNSGVFDAARIALINEQPAAVLTPTALGFYTNTSPSADDTAATEKMRITSKGVIQQQDHNWSFVISKTYTSTFTMFDVQCDVGDFASCIVKIAGSKRSPGSDDHVGIKEYSCYKRSGALDWVVAEVASAGYNNDLTTTVSNTTINFISPFGGNNNFCYYSVTVIGTARDSSTKSDLRVITYGD